MADTLGNRLTLLDIARREDPDGRIANIVEVLDQTNPVLQDAPAYPSNARMGNRVTLRSTLPSVAWARVNAGYVRSKGSTRQVVDTIGLLTGLSEVDSKLKKIVGEGNFNAARWSEDQSFLEAMSQEVAGTLLYGNEATEEVAFTGLAPRMASSATAITGSQVRIHHASPSGSDYTSMYVVDWGERGAHLIYPKESMAGIDARDLGEQRVTDPESNPMMAHVMAYDWLVGLTVKDPRHIARLANIDVSQALSDTSTLLVNSLVRLLNGMPPKNGMNRVIYCARDILSALELQVMSKSNVWLSIGEYLGEKTLMFRGNPIRVVDQMSITESAIS